MIPDNQASVRAFIQGIPSQRNSIESKPTIPPLQVRILRARLMLEEVMETIQKGLGLDIRYMNGIKTYFEDFRFTESENTSPNIREIADGLADQEVVNLGTAIVCGIDHQKIFEIVMNNNLQKLERGTIDEYGKLVKPPDHVGPEDEITSELYRQAERSVRSLMEETGITREDLLEAKDEVKVKLIDNSPNTMHGKVYAVAHDDFKPYEIDSLWANRDKAEKRATDANKSKSAVTRVWKVILLDVIE